MTDVPFITYAFAATGGSATRTMPDRLADVVNVRDFGAAGTGAVDDSTSIQAAFDAAFGSSGSPHGITNAKLNRAVYFPAGSYGCHGLTLTDVYGGRIFGAAQASTRLIYNGAALGAAPLLRTNGFSYSTIENLTFAGQGVADGITNDVVSLDLDWGGSGTVGLNNSMLINVGVGSCYIGCRIAESGYDGASISLVCCNVTAAKYGWKQNSDDCLVSAFGGGPFNTVYGFWVKKGSLVANGAISAGISDGVSTPGQTDILHESSGITTYIGARCEAQNLVYITAGKVHIIGTLHQQTSLRPGGLGPVTVDGTGGEVTMNGCTLGNIGNVNTGLIIGSPTVSIRNVHWVEPTTSNSDIFPGASFTGTISQWLKSTPFTMATLPPRPADGVMVSVSNASAAGAWGSNVTGTGSDHALLRWNGSQWTLVGK